MFMSITKLCIVYNKPLHPDANNYRLGQLPVQVCRLEPAAHWHYLLRQKTSSFYKLRNERTVPITPSAVFGVKTNLIRIKGFFCLFSFLSKSEQEHTYLHKALQYSTDDKRIVKYLRELSMYNFL